MTYQQALDEIANCRECEDYMYDEGEIGYTYVGIINDTHYEAVCVLQELIDSRRKPCD